MLHYRGLLSPHARSGSMLKPLLLRYFILWRLGDFLRSSGSGTGPFSLPIVTEELLQRKSSGSGSRKPRLTVVGIRCANRTTPLYAQNLALTSLISGGRSWQIYLQYWLHCRSLWPRSLRHELSSPSQTLESWVRIPLEASMCLRLCCFVCRQTPCEGLIPRLRRHADYVYIINLKKSGQGPTKDCRAITEQNDYVVSI
jgi:hypothetical protein